MSIFFLWWKNYFLQIGSSVDVSMQDKQENGDSVASSIDEFLRYG